MLPTIQYITIIIYTDCWSYWLPYSIVLNPSSLNPQLAPIVTSGNSSGDIWSLYMNQLAMYIATNKGTMLTSYVTTRASNQLHGSRNILGYEKTIQCVHCCIINWGYPYSGDQLVAQIEIIYDDTSYTGHVGDLPYIWLILFLMFVCPYLSSSIPKYLAYGVFVSQLMKHEAFLCRWSILVSNHWSWDILHGTSRLLLGNYMVIIHTLFTNLTLLWHICWRVYSTTVTFDWFAVFFLNVTGATCGAGNAHSFWNTWLHSLWDVHYFTHSLYIQNVSV